METSSSSTLFARVRRAAVLLLTDWRYFGVLSALLLAAELALGVFVLTALPGRYTEIDWVAYMEEVEGWLGGENDYAKLRGGTGPLVYPAGFVYAFSSLRWLVGGGGRGALALLRAQSFFLAIYLATLALVLRLYNVSRCSPPWVVVLLVLSKRLHSLYYLRLFNDCLAMALNYAAILLLASGGWLSGVLMWSLGVSVKMNGLLLLPALGILLLRNTGVVRTSAYLSAAIVLQVALGAPFLATFPTSYLTRSFELSRVFLHQWTVNWKFLPEETFVHPTWARFLLCGHVGALLLLAHFSWCAADGGLWSVLIRVWQHEVGVWRGAPVAGGVARTVSTTAAAGGDIDETAETIAAAANGPVAHRLRRRTAAGVVAPVTPRSAAAARAAAASPAPPPHGGAYADSPAFIVFVLLACNFVGVAFARTLHYQFFTWYAHALPLLLWRTDLALPVRLAVLAAIEAAFNTGDAAGAGTPLSSAALTSAHLLLLTALFTAKVPDPVEGTRGEGWRAVGGDSSVERSDELRKLVVK